MLKEQRKQSKIRNERIAKTTFELDTDVINAEYFLDIICKEENHICSELLRFELLDDNSDVEATSENLETGECSENNNIIENADTYIKCKLCNSAPCQIVLLPCTQLCVCFDCWSKIEEKTCPLCNNPVDSIIRIN